MIDKEVIVIGAGLAGSEAAWQIANSGIPVILVEMRPLQSTPAHHSSEFGELQSSISSSNDGTWLDFVRGAIYFCQKILKMETIN